MCDLLRKLCRCFKSRENVLGVALPSRASALIYLELERLERLVISLSFIVVFFVFVLAAGSAFNAPSAGFSQFFKVLAVGAIVATASAALGALLGFLFGIPRVLQKGREPPKSNTAATAGNTPNGDQASSGIRVFSTNTSFEEISDWLTKIIVGIGLVQFDSIVHYLYTSSMVAASYMRGQPVAVPVGNSSTIGADIAVVFFFSLILTCLIASCLLVYIETRTRLTLLLLRMERINGEGGDLDFKEPLKRSISDARPIATLDVSSLDEFGSPAVQAKASLQPKTLSPVTEEDKKLLLVPRSSLKGPIELAGWAAARIRNGDAVDGMSALKEAADGAPQNNTILERLAEAQRLRSDNAGFVDTVAKLIALRMQSSRQFIGLAQEALLYALYLPAPIGYESAITIGNFLISDHDAAQLPINHVRLACAFAQKYATTRTDKPEEANSARTQALEAVKRVIALAPDPNGGARLLLRQLLDPANFGGNPNDNDLEVFKSDSDFREVILNET